MHLVIATRADPPLLLARLRGRGQLTELGAADLRFTTEEAAAFFNQVMGLGLTDEDVATLEDRTEGWIVGLQMAALSMRGRKDVSGFIKAFTGSHRFILDYLVEEVFDRYPPAVQEFLLKTSILERMTAPLCDAVLDDGPWTADNEQPSVVHRPSSNSQDMLGRLEQANLFIIPLDDERRWYRYHHLFADLLRNRLEQTQPYHVPALHRRASEWYEGAKFIEEAIAHAFAGADIKRAANLVEQNAMQMIIHGKLPTLSRWLEALPDELVRARPWLCVYYAWTQHWSGQRQQVEDCLQCAEQALESAPLPSEGGLTQAEKRRIAGYIAAIRAHNALTNEEIPRVVETAQRALELLPEGDYLRYLPAVALGGAYWSQGDVVAAQQVFAQARATARRGGYQLLAVPAACYVGMQQTKQGQLREAFETYREALEWATRPDGRPMPLAGFPSVKLGDLVCE